MRRTKGARDIDGGPVLTPDAWLQRHPYLRDLALFSSRIDAELAALPAADAVIPAFDDHVEEFRAGVPLLQSATAHVDLEPAGAMTAALVRRLAADPPGGGSGDPLRELDRELGRTTDAPRRIAGWLLGDDGWTPASTGLLRYLGWSAAARHLRPTIAAFASWRDEERWQRSYCPVCGSPPAMAQLVGNDPGRIRLLSCGRCRARWQFPRTACPFCESDAQRIATVAVEGEDGLRIDHCDECRAYLKTYSGQGNEALLLSDWSSLHLDVLALDRGWKRAASSLYELPAESPAAV